MAEERIYTIVVKNKRIEVSKAVYYAYHQEREAERYQKQIAHKREMSLERFQEEGVNVEYRLGICQTSIEDDLIKKEEEILLYQALDMLKEEDRFLIEELFFRDCTEVHFAQCFGITQQAVSKRKRKLLKQLRILLK